MSPKRKKFHLKKRPGKPKRTKTTARQCVEEWSGKELLELLTKLADEGVNLSEVLLDHDNYWGNCDGVYLKWKRNETDKSFYARMSSYRKRLKEYESWYKDNLSAVKEELEARKKEQKAIRDIKLDKLRKEIRKLEESK